MEFLIVGRFHDFFYDSSLWIWTSFMWVWIQYCHNHIVKHFISEKRFIKFFSLYNAFDFPIWIHDANKRENGKSYPPITKYYVPSDEYTQNLVFGFREMDWLKTHIITIAWKKICCSAIKTVIIWMCSCVDNNSYLNLIKEQATTNFYWYYLKT